MYITHVILPPSPIPLCMQHRKAGMGPGARGLIHYLIPRSPLNLASTVVGDGIETSKTFYRESTLSETAFILIVDWNVN